MTVADGVYDVVIVGAGSAGSVLAGRLSEDSSRSVLLLEAGPDFASHDVPPAIRRVSSLAASVPGHPYNWDFVGQLTPELASPVPRGKVVGGSSAINGAYFVRATPQDFDRWVQLGNDAWSFDEVLPYFNRLEADADFRGQYHGSDGPIPVRRQSGGPKNSVTAAFQQACLDYGFDAEPDKNRPGPPGIGPLPLNADGDVRVSAAMAYIPRDHRAPNLTVRADTFVRRILFAGTRAIGVEIEAATGGLAVFHGAEIILCAGAIKSPHLLMLSGVGPADRLRALGIKVIHSAPGVGRDFVDHPDLWVTYRPARLPRLRDGTAFAQVGLNYATDGSYPAGDMEILCVALSLEQLLFAGPSGRGPLLGTLRHPRIALRALRGIAPRRLLMQARTRTDLALLCGLQQEHSRGELRIRSADPRVPPMLDYRYLSEPSDVGRLRDAVRLAVALLEAPALREHVERRTQPTDDHLATDSDLDRWIRGNIATAVHMTGTCRMGPASDEMATVDQFFRVHGLEGIRIVDSSTMPHIPSRGPNASVMMLGERAADFIISGFPPDPGGARDPARVPRSPAGPGAPSS